MDARHFDSFTRALSETGTRRGLLGLLAALPVLGGFALLNPDESDAKGRRKRRKKKHKHGKGRRRKHHKKCQADSKGKTCAGKCGPVINNCQKTVDCGSCACTPACEVCFICQEGPNTPGECVVDSAMAGESCGAAGQVCQADGDCVCTPVDPCTGSVCGTVTNNCGDSITCDPCPPPAIATFSAAPISIDRGATPPETSTLSWSTSNATTCSIDNGVGSVSCNDSSSVAPDTSTTYTLSASGVGGGPVTAQVTVTVEFCHSVTSSVVVCPTGNSEFCQQTPIVASSSAQARAACEACFGAGNCIDAGTVEGAGSWANAATQRHFTFSDGVFNPMFGCGGVSRAGDITDSDGCPEGRWAP